MATLEDGSAKLRKKNGSPVRAEFGRRVRELRKAKGYSQEGFAALSGLDRSYYGRVERGEQNVSLDNIATIARALKEPIGNLFPLENESAGL